MGMKGSKSNLFILTGLCLALPLEKTANAAQWEVKGQLGQQLEYNDNLLLSTDKKQPAFGYYLAPTLVASRKTGILELEFKGVGNIRHYDDSRLDCEAYNLNADNRYKTKDSSFSLSGGYGTNCSYSLQVTPEGTVVPSSQSENYQISPTWTWQWAAQDQLVATGGYSNTTYTTLGETSASILSGNEIYTVDLTDKHLWSPNLTFSGGMTFANVKYTDNNASTQNIYGLNVGAIYSLNPQWNFTVGGGPRWINSETSLNNAAPDEDSLTTLGHAAYITLSYTGKYNAFSFGYSDSVNTSALNQTLQNQTISAAYSYLFSKRLTLFVNSRYSNVQSVGGESTANSNAAFDSTFFTASAGISWEFAQNWQLKSSYVYRWQEVGDSTSTIGQNDGSLRSGTSESNAVMLSIDYAWDGIRTSR